MKHWMMILEICGLFLLFMTAQGQYRVDTEVQHTEHSLTGNLQYDLSMDINSDGMADSSVAKSEFVYKKMYSPLMAGLCSAVIPGAGQFYTESYWQSAAFFGAEVLTWVMYATYENKADKQTEAFQKYANERWSVVRYALWINANFGQSISTSGGVNWDELNACEEAIGNFPTIDPLTYPNGTGFSHKLAPYGDQQYYEMIGKYSQFGGGWDDAATFQPGGFTKADVLANRGVGNVSPNFLKYRDMRGEANSFYNIATTVSYVIVANHVFSAIEAAWNAAHINHKIKLQGHIQSRMLQGNMVEFVPTLNVQYEL